MYEVTWMTYEIDWDRGIEEQCFTTDQFNDLDEAMNKYNEKILDNDVAFVKITKVLYEWSSK